MFGYEKNSNDLTVFSSGEDGLDELLDELNSGKILYGLVSVLDPNTDLPKYVFINWVSGLSRAESWSVILIR